ncbi:hypothetical protein P7H59_07260 [Enterococcus viikkiensis]|uniref:Uncharacterized protein n=1 Tax=Enterococcus viikkiensis TaxID=930854 RepID=A0ABU3FQJ4_9ENTE|nr:hypothetical protein [Enterococcus viikkiensis]MDT2828257.1 hypothetical protein [Enterococcus viikkiensis]
MKKIVMGICGLLMFCLGVASLRSGVLKADDLLQEPMIETTVPESSTIAPPVNGSAPAAPEVEVPAMEIPADVPEESTPGLSVEVPTTSEEVSMTETTAPTENSTEESPTTTSTSEDTSTNESSTSDSSSSDSSTSQSSTDQSATNPTSDTGTSSSGGSTSGGTLPSDSSSSWTQPSSPPPSSYEEPKQPIVPAAPQGTPAKTNSASAQASSAFTPVVPEAFSQSSTLDLPSELKTSEVAQSDLKGFELPLLSSFKDKAHGALVYDGIKKLGIEQANNFSPEQLATELYHNLFGIELSGTPEQVKEEINIEGRRLAL